MRSFIASVIVLIMIFSCVIPLGIKIDNVKKEILLHAKQLSPNDLSSSSLDKIISLTEENRRLFELAMPKNIYESMLLSTKKLKAYAKNGSADLFAAEYEVFLYYAEQLSF